MQDIAVNKKQFVDKIEIAENVSSKLKLSIKEYDNILIVFQVTVGLREIQKYVAVVDSVISEYKLLNQEVEVALDEGRQLIMNIANTPGKQVESSLPKSNENKAQTRVINRPHLGVQIVTLTEEVRRQINQDKNLNFSVNRDTGVLILKTEKNSPAAKSGIKPGDIILTIDGKAVTDVSEVTAAIRKSQVGAELPLEINRQQQRFKTLVRLEAKPNTSNLKEEEKQANNIDRNNTPENAIVEYYQLINERKYSSSWAILSSRFKKLQPDNNYKNYKEWWEKVASTRIISIQLVSNNKDSAVVDAKLKYFLKDGRQLDDLSRFRLMLNSNSKWLIDDKKKLEV